MLGSLFRQKKFKEPLNTKVYSTVHVTQEKSPIVLVSHELDGDWQFMGNEALGDYRDVARIISLEEVIKLDKSVLKVADLPLGYMATRTSVSEQWDIVKIDYSEDELKEFGFYCSSCGTYHKEIPMSYTTDAPYSYFQLDESEREIRAELTSDQCIIDNESFFVKGQVVLPVENEGESIGTFG